MAEDCPDGDYLGAYSRFFSEFVSRVNPYDQLPVSVSSYNVTEAEIVGEIINVTLQYLNQTQCPASLQAYLVHQVIQEIKSMCKKQPEDCGFKSQEKTYTSLKLMQAIINKVNEICTRYLDNSRLALLPPPPSTPLPQITAGGSKNCRRKMEDRYVILHDLHTTFGIEDDSIANYYAVFDGHAGQDAAVYCAAHLHQYLTESIYYPTDPERALRDAFLTTDRQFIEKSKTQKLCGGTTAVCTLILNKRLYVAWVGDSTAMLIKRDSVVQLVNPHRLHREDEVQRIRKAGGVVMPSMGTMRVNGVLGVSRAIGDVRYKPFVTGEPEVKSVPLDGTEDFLVLATDGLTDYLNPKEILTILYHEIQRNPNGFKRAYQILLHWAKQGGSEDNITVVVVLLTPANAIAARPLNAHPYFRLQVNDILEKMNSKDKPLFMDIDDAHNAINSNILKQSMISQEPRDDDGGILAASNGKHENGDADYDYSDLGPETNVDAIDDVTMPVKNLSYEFYKDDDICHEDGQTDNDSNILDNRDMDESINANLNANTNIITHEQITDNNLHENNDDDDDDDDDEVDENDDDDNNDDELHQDNDDVPDDEVMVSKTIEDDIPENEINNCEKINNEICEQLMENIVDEKKTRTEDQADMPQDVVDEAGPVDYDESPPSPQANKPLQHALIHEPDNVAESEDSEDEWNYYRVDPNKEKNSETPVNEPEKTINVEEESEISELPVEDTESKIQSENIEENIKCENLKEEESPELINIEISAEDKEEKLEKIKESCIEEENKLKDMDFQLNPNAAEFIPVSPQFMGTRMDLVEDFPVSGSPFKQVPQMDDIQVPSQSEFEKEVCQRPREVDSEEKEYQNGDNLQHTDYTDFLADKQKVVPVSGNMDDSEISSTKAEFGDESSVSFLTASEFHRTGISAIDESFSSCEREYDIAKDPMAMSFTPSDFEAAFDKGVDLNAVHDLSNTDLEETNGILDKEEEEEEEEEEVMAESPNLENDTVNDKMLIISNTEKPMDKTEKSEIRAEFVNLSSQQDYSEDTFIEHADELKANTIDFLNLQPESSNQQEPQETARYDHSPLTENYSGEFESEKEAVSVDNEQPLSPSSADIDETKPIDETSEDAALLGNELQKEICSNDGNTPSSLSPIPDAMESDLAAESAEIQSSKPVQSSLHPDAPEFTPENYNFQSFGMDNNDVCQVSHIKATDSYQAYSTEAGSAFEIVKQDLVANIQFDEKEDEPVYTKPLVDIKPEDFSEEQDVCVRPLQIHSELTPPLSPQEEKHVHDIIYPVKSSVDTEVIESKEIPEEANIEDKVEEMMESMKESMETNISTEEIKSVESEEPIKESILNLSDSMQEFTGLESQLQPTEEEVFKPKIVEDLQEEIIKKEELIDVTEPEKSSELPIESEYMIQEQREVQEVKEIKEVEIEQLKLKEPEVEQMEIQEPEFKEPEFKEPEFKEPEFKEPEFKEPEFKEPEFKEPEFKESEVEESEVKEPEIKEFEMKESEIKESKFKEPEIEEHKIKELQLEIKESEIKESEIKKSEINEPEIKEPEIKEPEIKEPEIKEPEIKESEIKEPEIKESEIKEPEIKEPEIKEPEIKESEIEVSSQKPEIKELLKEPEIKETEIKELEIEKVAEVPENKVIETAAIATATAAVVASAAGAVAAQSKAKAKTLATKPTKTTTSKATPTRSTPTSPSKTVSSTSRTSTTAMKKLSTTTPSRPKDLDAPKKSTISSTTASKPSVAKSASKTTTSTTATKSTNKTSVSSTTSKPKPIATTAPKSTVTDKKPTANGDVKSLSKSATATKSSSKASPLATKTTLVKTSSTRASTGTTTVSKVRSSSANKLNTTAKTSSTTTTVSTASNRPKTAPSSGTASKPRMSLNKLPAIDKQVKETANKQISMGRTSTPASKTTSRLSTTSSSTTTIKRASLTAKTTTVASPTKKSTPVSKTSKTSLSGKTAGEKGKILQNGVSENVEINTIIDDMPKKDLSPVVTPNDNQLIMSSD